MPRTKRTEKKKTSRFALTISRPQTGWKAHPLEQLTVTASPAATIVVRDSIGREYFRGRAAPQASFQVGGSLGKHTVAAVDSRGRQVGRLHFDVDAQTTIADDGGEFADLLAILRKTMTCYHPTGEDHLDWRGHRYSYFVYWILDHGHTAKGMQYFSPHTSGLVDLCRQTQREDGMIWSNFNLDRGPGWWDTIYGPYDYTRRWKGLLLVRQPVENHPEYCFVDALWRAWKGSGDDGWMRKNLKAAMRALDYSMKDRSRWSARFGLLKRGYTIDSWDFQIDDGPMPQFPVQSQMLIDPDRTKFGVFYGDNTGYAMACDQLAQMLAHAGKAKLAAAYRQRAADIRKRLNEVAWNGRFFTHRVEEDPTIKRDLGVDESSQISFSNAYSLNRGLAHDQCVAIINTYRTLRNNLPAGSPGEWYAIYPPFERGFSREDAKWEYMNGGVHGHAAGELALGALEHGFEQYGADILQRVRLLAKKNSGIVKFAYTGAVEVPLPQTFTPIDISAAANMDTHDQGADGVPHWFAEKPGNDMRNLPVGEQSFAGVRYCVPDPQVNGRRGAVAVAKREGFVSSVEVPVGRKAGAVYLLHTAGMMRAENVAAVLTFAYADGTHVSQYVQNTKHLSQWWFPQLKSDLAGVAWRGPNGICTDVGVCWAVIANPQPDKEIRGIRFSAAEDGAIYAVLGLTLADKMPSVPKPAESYGGPDNWSGGCCMLALMEGLAGVADAATAYGQVRLSPRWTAAAIDKVAVTARYAASDGYVAYEFHHDRRKRAIEVTVTGSGRHADVRVLLPKGARRVVSAGVDGKTVEATSERVERSTYAVIPAVLGKPVKIRVVYR